MKEAVETGLLCSFSVYLAETKVDISNVKVTESGDYDLQELERAIDIYSRNKSAIELYNQLVNHNEDLSKAVVYCVSVKHAKEVARLFSESGIPAAAVYSDQAKDERRHILKEYEAGNIKVLTNVNVLTEGFDDPEAALCINLRPTLSRVVAKQRGGRVLRLDPNNTEKHAIVIDYLDKNEDKRNLQVTFAQVAEGAEILNAVKIKPKGPGPIDPGDEGGNGPMPPPIEPPIEITPPFFIEGLNVITSTEEVLRIITEIESQMYTTPPEGWMTFNAFVNSLDKTYIWLRPRVLEMKDERPDLFGFFLGHYNVLNEYFSPEIVSLLINDIGNLNYPPEAWIVRAQVSDVVKRSEPWVSTQVEILKETHPEWVGIFLGGNYRNTVFVSPEALNFLKAEATKYELPPEDWTTLVNVSRTIGKSAFWIKRRMEEFKDELTEDKGTFFNKKGVPTVFLSPHSFSVLNTSANKKPPENWFMYSDVGKKLKAQHSWLKARVSRLRDEHPDWFGNFQRTRWDTIFMSPDAFSYLKRERDKFDSVPEGWMNKPELVVSLDRNYRWIDKRIKSIQQRYPNWVRSYLSPDGKVIDYCSPEAISELENEARLYDFAPAGWFIRAEIKRLISRKKHDKWLASKLEELKESRPDLFKTYRNRRGIPSEHILREAIEWLLKQ